jgi:Prokaryotic RING finger family 1
MDKYHQGPYQHMSPSGFPGFLLIILAISRLWVLFGNSTAFYLFLSGITIAGAVLAIFLRKYFRRQSRAEEISLFGRTEDDFERANRKLSSTRYDALFNNNSPDASCPYCKNHFLPSELVMLCDKCKSVHHLDCWNANSGCGIFGCDEKKASKIEEFIRQ